jgi:predicted transcriptional regulator
MKLKRRTRIPLTCQRTNRPAPMVAASIKAEARKMVESLADNAAWDDLMHQILVRQAIEAGLKDADDGHLVDTPQVRSELGLTG